MNAILLLPSRRQPTTPPGNDACSERRGPAYRAPANDEVLPLVGPAGEPEAVMVVSFEGLSDDEQRKALDSFPGGRRCLIAGD